MGTTTEKINYAINATNDIAEGINNIGGNITQNTELADFKDELDILYRQMPKVSQDGTSITLSNTRRGKITITPKGNTVQAILPSEYQQVEYIESTRTQYIDTGINADYKLSVFAEMAILSDGAMGAIYNDGSSQYIRHHFNYNNSQGIRYYYKAVGGDFIQLIAPSDVDANKHTYLVDIYNNIKQIDESSPESIRTRDSFDTQLNYWLFKRNSNVDSLKLNLPIKLYSFKMYYENELVRDFIPCYRKADNEIGLYDLVNNVFYANEGTGTFEKGNDIPNPDYPQDIKVVTGENNVIIRGKNLANWESGDISSGNGQDVSTQSAIQNAIRTNNYIPLNYGDTISEWHNFEIGLNIRLYDANKNYLGYATFNNNKMFTNTNQNATYVRFRASHPKSNTDKIIIAYSNVTLTENDFEPYIEPITKELNLSSKNLFDGIWESGSISDTNGTAESNNRVIRSKNYISVKPNTEYTVSAENNVSIFIYYYDENKNYISVNNTQVTPKTFTTPINAYYVRIRTRQSEDVTDTSLKCQLEKGPTATSYEIYYNYELAKNGDYSDLIFKNEKTNPYYDSNLIENAWYKKEKIKKVNGRDFVTNIYKFDKSTAYSDTTYLCCFNNNFKTVNDYVSGPLYCTHFDSKKHYAQEKIANNMYLGSSSLGICVLNTDFSSATELNEYFSENDIIAYLPKQTSSNIPITDTTLINQLEELNKVIGQGGTVIVETESEEENAQLIVNASALASFENS